MVWQRSIGSGVYLTYKTLGALWGESGVHSGNGRMPELPR